MSQGRGPQTHLILSYSIFKKKVCCNFSVRPDDGFSWDKVQMVDNLCSYGFKSCNFKAFMYKYLFHDKNPKNKKKMDKIIAKKSVFDKKKILTHQNLKIETRRPRTT